MKYYQIVFVLLLGVFSLLLSTCSKSASAVKQYQKTTIKVVTSPPWAPFEFKDENGSIVGFDIDLINAVCNEIGLKCEITTYPWDGIFLGLKAKRFDALISMVSITEERKKMVSFTDPYLTSSSILIVPATDLTTKTLQDLKDGRIGTIVGTTDSDNIQRLIGKSHDVAFDEIKSGLDALKAGKINGFALDINVALYYMNKIHEYRGAFKTVEAPWTSVDDLAIVVAPDNQLLVDKLNEGLKKVNANGVMAVLKKKWFN